MAKPVILIIEDEAGIREMLAFAFEKEGWRLLMAKTGEEGMAFLKKENASCVILDIMLPGMDGFTVLKKLKADVRLKNIPVIMTTARGEESDVVTGLELGADDYVVKPYSPRVLAARVRAALRRLCEAEEDTGAVGFWQQGPLSVDASRHEARSEGELLDLSATQFALLKHFLSHPDRVFSRSSIIEALHGPDYPATDRSVDVQILALRKKLKNSGDMIETIRGVGYRMRVQSP
ncbi:MAG: response regulator transcription factor [Spirochaetales bacterium]|nr:response regulator transcription factor [Spirochaetales bacterium]